MGDRLGPINKAIVFHSGYLALESHDHSEE